jgi:hypothetical protein
LDAKAKPEVATTRPMPPPQEGFGTLSFNCINSGRTCVDPDCAVLIWNLDNGRGRELDNLRVAENLKPGESFSITLPTGRYYKELLAAQACPGGGSRWTNLFPRDFYIEADTESTFDLDIADGCSPSDRFPVPERCVGQT